MRKYHILLIAMCFFTCLLHGQNKIIDTDIFWGETNDQLYWKNESYSISESPLNRYDDHRYIYPQFFIYNSCRITYESCIDEKEYIVRWAIVNDSLYLCSTTWNCDTGHADEMLEYYRYMSDPFKYDSYLLEHIYNKRWLINKESIHYLYTKSLLTFDANKNIMNPPLEKLTGLKFRQSPHFPTSIMNIPMTSDGVIPAVWFSGILHIHSNYSHMFAPYKRLTFERGKIVSIQQMTPGKNRSH